MSFFDKNLKRIRELERELQAGRGDPEKVRARIEELEQKPDWFVDYRDVLGRRHEEKCPPEYQNERAAARYHALCVERVRKGAYNPPDLRKAKVAEITAAYLERKRKAAESSGKVSTFNTAKYSCQRVNELIGDWRLDRMDADPEMIVDFFSDFPRRDWSPKTVWNFFTTLKAAINSWIRFKRLVMKNPCEIVELDPQTCVQDYVPTPEDFEKVFTATYVVGLPDWIRHLFTAVYESGLRINEVLRWRIENIDMSAPVFGENSRLIKCPTFLTEISKQRRLTRKRIPMSSKLWQALRAQIGARNEGLVFGHTRPPYQLLRWLRCPECGLKVHGNEHPYRRAGDQCLACGKAALISWTLAQEAGVPFYRPFHDYRKSVKHLNKVEKGLPQAVTMAFQGHSSAQMDEYYTHLSAADLIPAVEDSWRCFASNGDQMETRKGNGDLEP